MALAEGYRIAVVALGLLAGYALWRRWLPPWWAWLASILALSADRVSNRFVSYRPESFGLVLVLWAGWLLDVAFERRSWRWGALAGLVSGSAFLAHVEAWLFTAPLWAGVTLVRFVPWLTRWIRRGTNLSPSGSGQEPRLYLGILVACGLTLASTIGLGSFATDGGETIAGLVGGAGESVATTSSFVGDPTWALRSAMYAPASAAAGPPDLCEGMFKRASVRRPYIGLDLGRWPAQLVLAAGALLVLIALPRAPAPARRGVGVWIVFVLGVTALAGSVCAVYDTYVPERAGPVRIMPMYVFGLAGLLAGTVWVVWSTLRAALRRWWPDRYQGIHWVEGALMLLVSAPLLLAFTPMGRGEIREPAADLPLVSYQTYRWMDENLPHDAIILANGFTEGSLGAISKRTGWLDGRSPYMESREWLLEARRELLQARMYFRDPVAHADLLPDEVDYLVVARRDTGLGGSGLFPTDFDALRASPRLHLVREFGGGRIMLYEVTQNGR